jgi:hypothetical protein
MSSQWKQFLELYAEKNQHLSHQEVLQMAKKPFQKLKQYYKQQGGTSRLSLFPKCEEPITYDMLGDDDIEDKRLLEKEYYPDHGVAYNQFAQELQEIIGSDCWGVVVNGEDVLYSYYDEEMRSDNQKKKDNVTRTNLIANIHEYLLKDLIESGENAFFDIYLFEDKWFDGGLREFGPRKYQIEYNANEQAFDISIFQKSKESFDL